MSEEYTIHKCTDFLFEDEASEGDAPTFAGGDVILAQQGGEVKLGRTIVDRNLMTGNLDSLGHMVTGYDATATFTTELKGSGTHGVAPETGDMFKNVFGAESVGIAGTVAASPSPTTTGCTTTSDTTVAGHIARVETAGTLHEYVRVLTSAAHAHTWWPPTTVAPDSGDDWFPGVAYLLKSARTDFTSGCIAAYPGGSGLKIVMPGARGKCKIRLKVNEPAYVDWEFKSLWYTIEQAAQLTTTPDVTYKPPICKGIITYWYYDGVGAAGSTTTSTVVSATPPWEATTDDYLIIDVGSSVYETQKITGWTFATQTATTSAFGGALSAGEDCYLRRNMEINNLEISIDPGWEMANVSSATYGHKAQVATNRKVTVDFEKYFKSDYEYLMRDNLMAVEIWAILGTISGRIIALNCPNVLYRDVSHNSDALSMVSVSAQSYMNSVAGNDTVLLTFL
jgi:hypothetical protein